MGEFFKRSPSYLNHPEVQRRDIMLVLRLLGEPMSHTVVRELRRSYEKFQQDQDIRAFIGFFALRLNEEPSAPAPGPAASAPLSREDLHLICFDFVCS